METTTYLLAERIFLTVFPLFAIVVAGYIYGRYKNPDMSLANQLNMDIFVPALIFFVLSDKSFNLLQFQSLAIGAAVVILASGALLFPVCRLLNTHPKTFLPPISGGAKTPIYIRVFAPVRKWRKTASGNHRLLRAAMTTPGSLSKL